MPRHHYDASRAGSLWGHWALNFGNSLEGFHIPFVHEDLDAEVDSGAETAAHYF
jgi:choline monooxygenase